jgi:hypothetical protein
MACASHCSKSCTKCSSVIVQAKLLILKFFLLLYLYLFQKKIYTHLPQKFPLLLCLICKSFD